MMKKHEIEDIERARDTLLECVNFIGDSVKEPSMSNAVDKHSLMSRANKTIFLLESILRRYNKLRLDVRTE